MKYRILDILWVLVATTFIGLGLYSLAITSFKESGPVTITESGSDYARRTHQEVGSGGAPIK